MLLLFASLALAGPTPRIGAYGHMVTHPGLTAGLEWPLARADHWSMALAGDVGTYLHPRNQVATWARGEWAGRHHGGRGGTHELFLTTGPLRATWALPTYAAVDGDLRRQPLSGDTYWTVGGGIGLGREPRDGAMTAWLVRPQLQARFPHFHGVGLDVGVELSTRFGARA